MTKLREAPEALNADLSNDVLVPIAKPAVGTGLFGVKLSTLKTWFLANVYPAFADNFGKYLRIKEDGSGLEWAAVASGGAGVPPGGTTGQVLGKLSNDDGDADWIDQTGGSGGGASFEGYELIGEYIVPANGSDVPAFNVSGYSAVRLVASARASAAVAFGGINVQLNGATTEYYNHYRYSFNNISEGVAQNNVGSILLGEIPGGNAPPTQFGMATADFVGLSDPEAWTNYTSEATFWKTANAQTLRTMSGGFWNSSAIVNSLKVLGQFAKGSRFQLFGMRKDAIGAGAGGATATLPGIQSARANNTAYAVPADTNHKIPMGGVVHGASMIDAANGRLVVPAGVNRTRIDYHCITGNDVTPGAEFQIVWFEHRSAAGVLKGTVGAGGTESTFFGYMCGLSAPVEVVPGDYFECMAKIRYGFNAAAGAFTWGFMCWQEGALEIRGSASGGTIFPANPVSGQRFFRSDRGIEYYWDGTRWLSTTLYEWRMPNYLDQSNAAPQAMNGIQYLVGPHLLEENGVFIEDMKSVIWRTGTGNYEIKLHNGTGTNYAVHNINGLAASTYHRKTTPIDRVFTGVEGLAVSNIVTAGSFFDAKLTYRLIG